MAARSTRASPGTTASTYLVTFLPIFTITIMHFAAAATSCPRMGLTISVRPSGGWSISRYVASCSSSRASSRS
jgi:hypothetical protein